MIDAKRMTARGRSLRNLIKCFDRIAMSNNNRQGRLSTTKPRDIARGFAYLHE
jgi:hypothetical protein